MKITDEQLSAFLDAELTSSDMETVREALELNDDIVMRLAELSQVDQWVVENAEIMDAKPVPDKLIKFAQRIDEEQRQPNTVSNVVNLSKWKQVKTKIIMPMSAAASVVLAVTVGIATMTYQGDQTISSEIVEVLDSSISGNTSLIADNISVKAQLSFTNQNGDFCRQYVLNKSQATSTNIACKENNSWRVHATIQTDSVNTQNYQTAGKEQSLEKIIDSMITGAPLNREQEQNAISNQWQSK
jgi:negative regulator of sigma E activity